jgi:serine-type D-Ala-D-Ala carboxypeptidase/endopeptidase (penicillin-binding protein 4)
MHLLNLKLAAICLIFVSACAPARRGAKGFGRNLQRQIETSPVFSGAFTGFVLLDPITGKTLCDVNGSRHFTPASNTKILTLYTSLKVLGDSMPGIQYANLGNLQVYRGVGDPTFLNPLFKGWQQPFRFIQQRAGKYLAVWGWEQREEPWGPGWSWDDFDYEYSMERSEWTIYGNAKRVFALRSDSLDIEPSYFRKQLGNHRSDSNNILHINGNDIQYSKKGNFPNDFERVIPIRGINTEVYNLLEDTLKCQIIFPDRFDEPTGWKTIYSAPVDTVFRRLMHQSDNFIAEQLLLVCAGQKYGVMKQDSIIRYAQKNLFADLPYPPKWVDGSGLSRYNLMTPHFLTALLQKMWKEYPQPRLLSFFPAGGVSGTIGNWYKGPNGKPYVFAKTGSMSGVHCLSGYLVAKSGKTLVFSFMHNNFTGGSKAWKEEMQRVLERVRARY